MLLEDLSIQLQIFILQTQLNTNTLALITAVLWGIFFVNALIGKRLLYLGIIPRHLLGLPGILCAPLLHANFNHLFFNTIPLIVLSDFILYNGLAYYIEVTLLITVLSGLLIWLLCKPGLYVGASALITGYWAYLVFNIYQQGTLTAIILGVVCLYYFAGILLSLFPQQKGVSWQGHVCGLIAGICTNYVMSTQMIG